MGGAYERLTLYTPLISPLNPPHTHCVWGGGGTRGFIKKLIFIFCYVFLKNTHDFCENAALCVFCLLLFFLINKRKRKNLKDKK